MKSTGNNAWARGLAFFAIDLFCLCMSFFLAFLIKFGNVNVLINPHWRTFFALVLLVDAVLTLAIRPYDGIYLRRYYEDAVRSIGFVFLHAVFVAVLLYLFKLGARYSRTVVILMYGFYYVSSACLRYVWKRLVRQGKVKNSFLSLTRMLVLTTRDRASDTLDNIIAADTQVYDPVALCLIGIGPFPQEINGVPVVGDIDDFAQYAVKNDIPDVFIDVRAGVVGTETLRYLAGNGISVHLAIDPMIGFETEQQEVETVGIAKTVRLEEFSFSMRQRFYSIGKRMLDILFGIIGCVILVPVSICIKIAYLLQGDKAPVFYKHTRIGKDGVPFALCKFRSMRPDADEMLKQMLTEEKYRLQWEESQKFDDDPRITPIGRFIRRTSIDELPQLYNVLIGDMSLIGPRPLIEGELEEHGGMLLYQKIKPGITGWWACNGRSDINYRERLELEYYYIKHYSLYLDLMCIFRTVLAVLKRDGAR